MIDQVKSYIEQPDVRAALFDIDGTLTIGGDPWRALLSSPKLTRMRKGWLYAVALPHYALSRAGFVQQAGFRDRWIRLMARIMTGWTATEVRAVCERTVTECLVPVLRSDVVAVLNKHRDYGHLVVLVSTMFDGIVSRLAEYLGADAGLGTRIELRDSRCTGRIEGETCSGARQVVLVHEFLARNGSAISLDACAAYADSQSDIPLLASVGYPVAVYPPREMRAVAVERGWHIYPEM